MVLQIHAEISFDGKAIPIRWWQNMKSLSSGSAPLPLRRREEGALREEVGKKLKQHDLYPKNLNLPFRFVMVIMYISNLGNFLN